MSVRLNKLGCALLFVLLVGLSSSGQTNDHLELDEAYFFYDDSSKNDSESRAAVKAAVESGFRIREIAANRFPELANRFQVSRFPAMVLLRNNQKEDHQEGRFSFARIRSIFARARQNRLARRERIREFLVGKGEVNRMDAPESVAPIAPRYIQTMSNTVEADRSYGSGVPKPLDRNGRFAVAHDATTFEKIAFEATVRLRVSDRTGTSHGTGTVIHSSGKDALVLTCGHIFRESQGRGRIEADITFASGMKTVSGTLISYDAKAHDIALLTIRTPQPIAYAKVARQSFAGRRNDNVFTIGCDKGTRPTIRRSHFKRTANYDGTEKYDVFGRPIDGRSGGGLFNSRGELIGVCNAAAVHVDEGIYSGLKTIYRQLGISHLNHLFVDSYWSNSQSGSVAVASNRMGNVNPNQRSPRNQNQNGVMFQDLPSDPARAFTSLKNSNVGNPGQRNVVPVNSIRNEEAERQLMTEPRIPAFQLSNRLE